MLYPFCNKFFDKTHRALVSLLIYDVKRITETLLIFLSIISEEVVVQNCCLSEKNNQTLYWKIKGYDKLFPSSNEFGNQTPSTENIPQKEQLVTNSAKQKLLAQSMFYNWTNIFLPIIKI